MENQEELREEELIKIVRTTSAFDCGGRCPLKFHVEDGKITSCILKEPNQQLFSNQRKIKLK